MREPGSIVDEKYEVVESLGRGGMGEVYLVRHLHLEELRVIKILRQDLATDETARKRFSREARLATQIKHPNVAILYDFARLPEGSFYMVWEYVEGQHVGQWLTERGHVPALSAIELGIQGLRGLEAIHASGVIHRDISPDNLMITRDRRDRFLVKIIDLGLAKDLFTEPGSEVTQPGMFMGKLKYCSPEQAEAADGASVDLRSDLYSFGLVLYEMLCGLPPFDSESAHGSVVKRLSEPPLPLAGRNPEVEVPPALQEVLERALARRPEDRFNSAVSFIEALEPIAYELRQGRGQAPRVPRQRPHAPGREDMGSAPPTRDRTQAPRSPDDTGHLSREERLDLLAKIDRAAKKKLETTQVLRRAEVLLEEGDLEEARRLVSRVETAAPRARGLERLQGLLEEREETSRLRQRAAELAQMIEGYIQKGQLQLAELALETLVDLAPVHPRRSDYEEWIEILRDELEQDRRAEEAMQAGQKAVEEGNFGAARKKLAELRRHDRSGERAPAFLAEIETAERRLRQDSDLVEHRGRLEELLREKRLDGAETELGQLADLGLSRVSLDLYRTLLAEARATVEKTARIEELKEGFRHHLEAGDWLGARDAAGELETLDPASPRPAEMYAEIGRAEGAEQRRRAVEQGERQVEEMIRGGRGEEAELALKVLLRLNPGHPRHKQLEKQVRALREGKG